MRYRNNGRNMCDSAISNDLSSLASNVNGFWLVHFSDLHIPDVSARGRSRFTTVSSVSVLEIAKIVSSMSTMSAEPSPFSSPDVFSADVLRAEFGIWRMLLPSTRTCVPKNNQKLTQTTFTQLPGILGSRLQTQFKFKICENAIRFALEIQPQLTSNRTHRTYLNTTAIAIAYCGKSERKIVYLFWCIRRCIIIHLESKEKEIRAEWNVQCKRESITIMNNATLSNCKYCEPSLISRIRKLKVKFRLRQPICLRIIVNALDDRV